MRLVLAHTRWFPHGGVQRTLRRIARTCRDRGHDVRCVVGRWDGPRLEGTTVIEVGAPGLTNPARVRGFAERLRTVVEKDPADVIVGFQRMPGLDIHYSADPCWAARHEGGGPMVLRRALPRYGSYLDLERAVFARGARTQILMIAHGERERFMRHHDTEPERFHLLPPGIDRVRLETQRASLGPRDAVRRDLGVAADEALMVMIGSGFRTKGVDRAIAAIAATADLRTRLIVVGEDRRRAAWTRRANRFGLAGRVEFAGPREDVARYLVAADLLVHPARVENTGTAILEAMVLGCPVLCTENCGFAFHVERARAGAVCAEPFVQERFNGLLRSELETSSREESGAAGRRYSDAVDLYGLIDRAADLIIDFADHPPHRASGHEPRAQPARRPPP